MNNREKEFNTILDECLDRLIIHGEAAEQCLNDYPEIADELRPLLETAMITSSVVSLKPDATFRNRARAEMHSVLHQTAEKKRRSLFNSGWQRSLVTAMSVILAIFAVTGGTAAASSNAMPDSFLYPAKLATEKVQLAFTFTDMGKAETYARLADKRVEEIVYMANQENPDAEEINVLATNLNTNLLNVAVYSSRVQGEPVVMATKSQESLTAMTTAEDTEVRHSVTAESSDKDVDGFGMMAGPKATEPDFDEGVNDAEDTAAGAATVVEPPKPEITVEIPPTAITEAPDTATFNKTENRLELLNTRITEQANTNITRLYNLLHKVPSSARPAIERAIALSEEGYNIAINSLY